VPAPSGDGYECVGYGDEDIKILGPEDVVKYARTLVVDLLRGGLAGPARLRALKGSEEYVELKKPKRGKGEKKGELIERWTSFYTAKTLYFCKKLAA